MHGYAEPIGTQAAATIPLEDRRILRTLRGETCCEKQARLTALDLNLKTAELHAERTAEEAELARDRLKTARLMRDKYIEACA